MIQENKAWFLLDSSKLNDYLDCPRMFFYRHIIGWVPNLVSHHLIFGEGYHCIMEEILNNGYNEKAVLTGYGRHVGVWRKSFPSADLDIGKEPKTPPYALRAAMEYIVRYSSDDQKYETKMTEISGSAPLIPGAIEWYHRIHFRIDAVLYHKLGDFYMVREHKTATSNNRQYVNQWALDIQPSTYTHALYCLYPSSKVWGVEVNVTFFKKSGIEFLRIPVRKTQASLEVWRWTVMRAIERYRNDLDMLSKEDDKEDIMRSFPLNPRSCTKYYGCAYQDFCIAWPNPLVRVDELPQGFKIEFWDPRKYEQTKQVIL